MNANGARILTVSGLTEALGARLEAAFPYVWVRGEVSNLHRPSSGHIYFSLKDAASQLQCVWFASMRHGPGQMFDPMTGECFSAPRPDPGDGLRNGVELVCAGAIGVYAPRGQYQLQVEFVEASGAGLLARAFEASRRRLEAAGYFDQARKRPLPPNPVHVAVVASPAGAAIHDFLRLAADRGLNSVIRLFPAPAQGAEAAEKMAATINFINSQKWAEVIILIRGGGSLEDLWAFNEETLATAIHESAIPVLAGIGHEVDITLADMTADVRAATPSHAATLLWPRRRDLWQRVDESSMALEASMTRLLDSLAARLDQNERGLGWFSPAAKVNRLLERHARADSGLLKAASHFMGEKLHVLSRLESGLRRSPGLAGAMAVAGARLEWLEKTLARRASALPEARLDRLERLENRANGRMDKLLAVREVLYAQLAATLAGYDPELPLRRGYALLWGKTGLVTSAAQCAQGDSVTACLGDGSLRLTVDSGLEEPCSVLAKIKGETP